MNQIMLTQKNIIQKGGVVILPIREYQKLCEQAAPTYYLAGKEAEKLDKLVEEGLREYRAGRTKVIRSLSELDTVRKSKKIEK